MKHEKKPGRPLRKRVARDFAIFAMILSGFFCLVAYVAVEVIESQVVDARLDKIADLLIAQHLQGRPVDAPPEVAFFANQAIPASMRSLPPGLHEIESPGRIVEALIRREGTQHYAIVQEMTEFEHTELIIFSSLGAGFISSVLLAVVLGYASARRIAAPISALADAVEKAQQPDELPSLDADDEIGTLARAFAARTDELQRFLQRERLFTGDVSHELRTPLTIMLGASELLTTQLQQQPAQLAVAERLHRVALETSHRVSALLLLSRAPEQLDAPLIVLAPLIEAELERCAPLLHGKPVALHFKAGAEVRVRARAELAAIAIGNLLRNACEHIEYGSISVQLEPDRLVIEDTGPGVPEAVRAHLFERFVHGTGYKGQGAGLGLSIVKRVAEHVGWTVTLDTPLAGGSRFTLVFAPAPDAP